MKTVSGGVHSDRSLAGDRPSEYFIPEHVLHTAHLEPASQPATQERSTPGTTSTDTAVDGQMSPSLDFLWNHVYFVSSGFFALSRPSSFFLVMFPDLH